MFVRRPRLRRRPRWLLGRLDSAAAALNPILTLVTIGLVLIDLIALISLLERKYVTASWPCSSEKGWLRITAQGAPRCEAGINGHYPSGVPHK